MWQEIAGGSRTFRIRTDQPNANLTAAERTQSDLRQLIQRKVAEAIRKARQAP